MKEGIQTNFPHEMINKYGCYFLCLIKWAELLLKNNCIDKTHSEKEIIEYYNLFVEKGYMEKDCFILNPHLIIDYILYDVDEVSEIVLSKEKPNKDIFIAYLKKPNYGHFILYNKGKTWDSLDPNRAGVKDYKIDSYRVEM